MARRIEHLQGWTVKKQRRSREVKFDMVRTVLSVTLLAAVITTFHGPGPIVGVGIGFSFSVLIILFVETLKPTGNVSFLYFHNRKPVFRLRYCRGLWRYAVLEEWDCASSFVSPDSRYITRAPDRQRFPKEELEDVFEIHGVEPLTAHLAVSYIEDQVRGVSQ